MRNGKINEHFSNHQQTQPPLQGEELCGKSPRVQPDEFWPQCISAMVIIISQQPCVPPGIALFREQKPKMDEELITPICLPCLCIFFLLFKVQGNKDIQEAARIQIHVDREIWSYFINCFSVPSPTFRRRMLGEAPTATLFSFSSQILIGPCGGDFPSVAKEEAVI